MVDELEPLGPKKERDPFAGHRDIKTEIKNIILHIEEHDLYFTEQQVIDEAKEHGITEDQAREAIRELMKDNWIHKEVGRDLLCRTFRVGDYSPAYEEPPEF